MSNAAEMCIEFSIVICTYNRADVLPEALLSACEQDFDPSSYEIIVVDNHSSDGTKEIIADYSRRFSNVRYLFEGQIGLSHARNCGWRNAKGEYVAYIDDDCRLPSGWLRAAKRIMEEHHPGAFGGPVLPFFRGPKPVWFKESYGTRKLDHGSLAEPSQIHGNNMIIRRKLLQQIGGFDANLGMKGEKIAYGEETRFFECVAQNYSGDMLYYDPDLYLYHLVRPEKMTFPWLIRGFFAKGRYSYLTSSAESIRSYNPFILVLKSCWMLGLTVFDLTIAAVIRNRAKYPFRQNYFYEHTSHYLKSLGRLYGKYELSRKKLQWNAEKI